MSVLFAVYGKHTQAALPNIYQYFQGLEKGSRPAFVPVFDTEHCVLGSLAYAGRQCSGSAHAPSFSDNASSFSQLPLLLHSRMSANALLRCNYDAFKCGNLSEFVQYLQSLCGSGQEDEALKQVFAKLNGDFTCVFANEHAQSLVLAVSAFNPQTLFYAALPEFESTYVISSELTLLLGLVSPQVDTASLAMWLSGRPDPNRSMFTNIHQVPQASMLTLNFCLDKTDTDETLRDATPAAKHTRLEKFWDIEPARVRQLSNSVNALSQEQLLAKLQEHLQHSIELNLQTAGDASAPVFTQLSGGMDSTSVSALACNALSAAAANKTANKAANKVTNTVTNGVPAEMPSASANAELILTRPLHSISHTYANTQSCDESDNIQAMIARFDFAQSHFIELDKYTELSFSELYPTHAQSPGMVLSPKYHEEAKLLKALGGELLLTGNGGDEMFWGHSFAYYDRLKSGDIKVVGEVIRGALELNLPVWQALKSVFLSPVLHYDIMPMLHFALKAGANAKTKADAKADKWVERAMHIPPWLTDKSEAMVREQQHAMAQANPFVSGEQGLTRYARYEGLFNTSTFNSMRSYQAVFDQYGLKVQHPMFDKHIAEFSFAVSQHKHISGKYPKLLLRQAMSENLPEQVCWNTHKTVFDQHFAKLVQQNQQALRKLLQHEGLAELGLVNNQELLATFDALVAAEQPSLNVDLLYAILVQSWYQTHILKV